MNIVILRCGNAVKEVADRRGDFDAWIRAGVGDAWKGDWTVHDLRTDEPAPAPNEAAAFIVTGSSSNVTEGAPWMRRAMDTLVRIVEAEVPLFGICFGHQLLAQALGGTVSKNPRGREIGTVEVAKVADDPLFASLPDRFSISATHVEIVTVLPPQARILATTALDPVAAFAIGDRARCVQFHPEFDADAMRGYIAARAHFMRAEGLDPDTALAAVREGEGAKILQNFVRAFVR
jgi:GMP synthase (glutamine-hydrolysing)